MGRKGGGKKAFLKGVVAKPDATDVPAESSSHAEPAVRRDESPDAEVQAAAPQQTREPTAQETVQTSDQALTKQQLDTETRGQLTQRQKKVP